MNSVRTGSAVTRPPQNRARGLVLTNWRKVNSFNNMSCNVKAGFRIMRRHSDLPSRRHTNATEHAMPIRKTRHKAELEAWLYLANRVRRPTLHKLSKLLYFADKFHLEHYGRLVTGDSYIAMKNGPVPSTAYDQAKRVRAEGESVVDGAYGVDGNKDVVPRRDADLQYLSETDVEALDHALETYGHLDFDRLTQASHDDSWKATTRNLPISWDDFTHGMRDRDAIVECLGA